MNRSTYGARAKICMLTHEWRKHTHTYTRTKNMVYGKRGGSSIYTKRNAKQNDIVGRQWFGKMEFGANMFEMAQSCVFFAPYSDFFRRVISFHLLRYSFRCLACALNKGNNNKNDRNVLKISSKIASKVYTRKPKRTRTQKYLTLWE